MDVVNAISWIFLFMAAGPFLEKLFLTSASQNYSSATPQKEPAQEGSVLGPFSAGVNFKRAEIRLARQTRCEHPHQRMGVYSENRRI